MCISNNWRSCQLREDNPDDLSARLLGTPKCSAQNMWLFGKIRTKSRASRVARRGVRRGLVSLLLEPPLIGAT